MGNEYKDVWDPFEWKTQQGVSFLSMALWELGLNEEPEKTLLEVVDSVHRRTGIFVIDLETARHVVETEGYIAHLDDQHLMRERAKRMEERQRRKENQIEDPDNLPF